MLTTGRQALRLTSCRRVCQPSSLDGIFYGIFSHRCPHITLQRGFAAHVWMTPSRQVLKNEAPEKSGAFFFVLSLVRDYRCGLINKQPAAAAAAFRQRGRTIPPQPPTPALRLPAT